MPTLSIEIDDREVMDAMTKLAAKAVPEGVRTVLAAIGERLSETTKQRFATSTAPDGTRWEPNADSYLLSLMRGAVGKGKGLRTQRGNTRAPAVKALAGKRPLVDTGELATTIRYQVGNGEVLIGTNRNFAATADAGVHQFGTKDERIPARPFLGLSTDDRRAVLEIVSRHLEL